MSTLFKRLDTELNITLITAITALYIILVNNQSFWSSLFEVVEFSRPDHLMFLLSVLLLVFAILYVLISLFSFRPIFKPAIAIFIIGSSIISYFIDSFGIIIDHNMIQNVIETDTSEAIELLNVNLLFSILVTGVIPAYLVTRFKLKHNAFKKEFTIRILSLSLIILTVSLATYISYKDISFIFRENRQITYMINPVWPVRSVIKYYRSQASAENEPLNRVFSDSSRGNALNDNQKKSIFVIVVGETARAENFHTNGYKRNTTPLIEKENIINFKDTSSCGTATAISVPCMFSHLGHDGYDDAIARNSENLLDALQHAGIDVLWRDNNSGCKGVCERVSTENMHHLDIADYCNDDGCVDEVMLLNLQEYIDRLNNDAVIVLHQQGSHGPAYFKRHPKNFAQFRPECNKADVQNCTHEEIVNAYDNTILYTDYFLSKVIGFLKSNTGNFNTAMLYISDHGESLGENGVYLHGLPYFMAPEEQTHVPFYLWLSNDFASSRHIDMNCLQQQQTLHHSHDDIVHTVLGAMDVKTRLHRNDHDIFASCYSNSIAVIDDAMAFDKINRVNRGHSKNYF